MSAHWENPSSLFDRCCDSAVHRLSAARLYLYVHTSILYPLSSIPPSHSQRPTLFPPLLCLPLPLPYALLSFITPPGFLSLSLSLSLSPRLFPRSRELFCLASLPRFLSSSFLSASFAPFFCAYESHPILLRWLWLPSSELRGWLRVGYARAAR